MQPIRATDQLGKIGVACLQERSSSIVVNLPEHHRVNDEHAKDQKRDYGLLDILDHPLNQLHHKVLSQEQQTCGLVNAPLGQGNAMP